MKLYVQPHSMSRPWRFIVGLVFLLSVPTSAVMAMAQAPAQQADGKTPSAPPPQEPLPEGVSSSEMRQNEDWRHLFATFTQGAIANPANHAPLWLFTTIEEMTDLSPEAPERLQKYGPTSLLALYADVIRAKLRFDAVHRSGNPGKIRNATQAYQNDLASIVSTWRQQTINVTAVVYHITDDHVLVRWSFLPLRYMPPKLVTIVVDTDPKTDPASVVAAFEEATGKKFQERTPEDIARTSEVMMENMGDQWGPGAPLIERIARWTPTRLENDVGFVQGLWSKLRHAPLKLLDPREGAPWLMSPGKAAALEEVKYPSLLLGAAAVPSVVGKNRYDQLSVGDCLDLSFRVVSVSPRSLPAVWGLGPFMDLLFGGPVFQDPQTGEGVFFNSQDLPEARLPVVIQATWVRPDGSRYESPSRPLSPTPKPNPPSKPSGLEPATTHDGMIKVWHEAKTFDEGFAKISAEAYQSLSPDDRTSVDIAMIESKTLILSPGLYEPIMRKLLGDAKDPQVSRHLQDRARLARKVLDRAVKGDYQASEAALKELREGQGAGGTLKEPAAEARDKKTEPARTPSPKAEKELMGVTTEQAMDLLARTEWPIEARLATLKAWGIDKLAPEKAATLYQGAAAKLRAAGASEDAKVFEALSKKALHQEAPQDTPSSEKKNAESPYDIPLPGGLGKRPEKPKKDELPPSGAPPEHNPPPTKEARQAQPSPPISLRKRDLPSIEPAVQRLLQDLQSPDAAIRYGAVLELSKLHNTAIAPFLINLLNDSDLFVRHEAVRALREMDSQEAVGPLIQRLSDDQELVRDTAYQALKHLTGQDFPFNPQGTLEERERAKATWKEWFDKWKLLSDRDWLVWLQSASHEALRTRLQESTYADERPYLKARLTPHGLSQTELTRLEAAVTEITDLMGDASVLSEIMTRYSDNLVSNHRSTMDIVRNRLPENQLASWTALERIATDPPQSTLPLSLGRDALKYTKDRLVQGNASLFDVFLVHACQTRYRRTEVEGSVWLMAAGAITAALEKHAIGKTQHLPDFKIQDLYERLEKWPENPYPGWLTAWVADKKTLPFPRKLRYPISCPTLPEVEK